MNRLGKPRADPGVDWPESRWQRPVNPARRLFPVAAGTSLGVLAAIAVALNVVTTGGNIIDFLAATSIPLGIGLIAAIVIAELQARRGR